MMEESPNVFEAEIVVRLSKKEYYEGELRGINPDAIFVLGGGNRAADKTNGKKRYTTSPYKGKFFPEKTGGAKARPVAAAELSIYYPEAKIVTMSHRPNHLNQESEQLTQSQNQPPFASVVAQDLERLKVNKSKIIESPGSTSTLTEMMDIINLCAKNSWQNAAVITNDYHVERALKFLEYLLDDDKRLEIKNQLQFLFKTGEETDAFKGKWDDFEKHLAKFKQDQVSIVFVAAEKILKKRSHHYEVLIEQLVETNGYKNVVEQERIGVEKMRDGKYDFAQDSFREYILATS